MPPDNPRPHHDSAQRLDRLEEASAFSDRAIEALTQQMLDLDRSVRKLTTRLEALERRLSTQAESTSSDKNDDPRDA